MQMPGDARPGAFSDVHSQIQSLGTINRAQVPLAVARQAEHLQKRFFVEFFQRRHMLIGDYHDVPAGVREAIQNHEIRGAAVDDEGFMVVGTARGGAENALTRLTGCRNVLIAPGSPEIIHDYGLGTCSGAGVGGTPPPAGVGAGAAELFTTSFNSLLGLK